MEATSRHDHCCRLGRKSFKKNQTKLLFRHSEESGCLDHTRVVSEIHSRLAIENKPTIIRIY